MPAVGELDHVVANASFYAEWNAALWKEARRISSYESPTNDDGDGDGDDDETDDGEGAEDERHMIIGPVPARSGRWSAYVFVVLEDPDEVDDAESEEIAASQERERRVYLSVTAGELEDAPISEASPSEARPRSWTELKTFIERWFPNGKAPIGTNHVSLRVPMANWKHVELPRATALQGLGESISATATRYSVQNGADGIREVDVFVFDKVQGGVFAIEVESRGRVEFGDDNEPLPVPLKTGEVVLEQMFEEVVHAR